MNLTWCRGERAEPKSSCPRKSRRLEVPRATAKRQARRRSRKLRKSKMAALYCTIREVKAITIVDLSGRISLGEGSALLRKTVRDLLDHGQTKILLNLGDVNYIDSSGIGELVSGFSAVRSREGELKLLNLTKKVHDLLQITKLFTVFEVYSDEGTAVGSFR